MVPETAPADLPVAAAEAVVPAGVGELPQADDAVLARRDVGVAAVAGADARARGDSSPAIRTDGASPIVAASTNTPEAYADETFVTRNMLAEEQAADRALEEAERDQQTAYDENPVAQLLGGHVGGTRWLGPTICFVVPFVLALAAALHVGTFSSTSMPASQRLLLVFAASLGVVAILIFGYATEWEFNRLVARLRRSPITDELLATALGVDEVLSGIEIAAQRRAASNRIGFVTGGLIALFVLMLTTRREAVLMVATLPVAILLGIYLITQRERVMRPRQRANSPRVQATTLIILANTGVIPAFALTALQPLVIASLLAVIYSLWISLAGMALFIGLLYALGQWLSSARQVEADDPFAVAIRRHLYPERRAGKRSISP